MVSRRGGGQADFVGASLCVRSEHDVKHVSANFTINNGQCKINLKQPGNREVSYLSTFRIRATGVRHPPPEA